jgi:dTMP kinase
MTEMNFFGHRPPGIETDVLPGRLIVIEATDAAGRSTHVGLLKEWLEDEGYAVMDTGLRRSDLAGPGIQLAKEGHFLDPITLNLFYATDLWDRIERRILPGLRAGMVVIADRYMFSLLARAAVRGVSQKWLEDMYGFALVPDRVIYLDIDVEHLVPRVLATQGFDYWESGQDFLRGHDMFQNFVTYQRLLLAEFRRLADRYGFAVVDARGSAADIFRALKEEVGQVVRGMPLDDPVLDVVLEQSDLEIGAFGSDEGAMGAGESANEIGEAFGMPDPVANGEPAGHQPSERSAFGGSSQRR